MNANVRIKKLSSIIQPRSGRTLITRRKFLFLSSSGLLTLLFLPKKVKGFFLGSLFRVAARSIGRSSFRSAIRSGASSSFRRGGSFARSSGIGRSTQKVSNKYRKAINESKYSSKSINSKTYGSRKRSNVSAKSTIENLSEIFDILPDLAELASEGAAEAIWVKSDIENEATINLENTTSNNIELSEVYVVIRDILTGEIESKTSIGLIQAKANAKYPFVIIISNLPKVGVKRLEVESNVECQPSRNIIVV